MAILARPASVVTWRPYVCLASLAALSGAWAKSPPDGCSSPPRTEHQYVLSARLRPLLFWIRRDDVGGGRITRSRCADGGQRLELLIGSDPKKTPFAINRWGYIEEATHRAGADVLGVMTQSGEESVSEAKANLEISTAGVSYRAITTRIRGGESVTAAIHIQLPNALTYLDLKEVCEQIRKAEGDTSASVMPVPGGADYGFLTAVANLVRVSMHTHQSRGQLTRDIQRRYAYANVLYDVTLLETKTCPRFQFGGTAYETLEGEFRVVNQRTGRVTHFTMAYGAEGLLSEVPVRITFRPK